MRCLLGDNDFFKEKMSLLYKKRCDKGATLILLMSHLYNKYKNQCNTKILKNFHNIKL